MSFKEPYIQINGILIFILLAIFSYSFFYPVLVDQGLVIPSSCEGMPEIYCRSRGLTRAFAQIIHLNFEKAVSLNRYAISIFSFFLIEFFARVVFSFFYLKSKSGKLIVIDSVFSAAYFMYTFFPLTVLYYLIWEK